MWIYSHVHVFLFQSDAHGQTSGARHRRTQPGILSYTLKKRTSWTLVEGVLNTFRFTGIPTLSRAGGTGSRVALPVQI